MPLLTHRYVTLSGLLLGILLIAILLAGTVLSWYLPAPEPPSEPPVVEQPTALTEGDLAPVEEVEEAGFSASEAGFAVQVKDEVIPYTIFGVFVMPGETLDIEAVFTQDHSRLTLEATGGAVVPLGPKTWRWTAPSEKGLHPVAIADEATGAQITLHMFVMVPFDHQQESLNGYRIGRYEAKPLRGDPAYMRPPGFVEVTPENIDTPVSPHYTLGQFLCKQASDFPKYLVLQERLLLKLEMILQEVNEIGIEAQTLHVMSAFRTPYYNRSIGNRTTYSQHLYGSAADIYVDTDEDLYMDDLTGDGEVTTADAQMMADIIEGQRDEVWYQPFIGGLGIYSPAPHRGPFIHVDVRGQAARW